MTGIGRVTGKEWEDEGGGTGSGREWEGEGGRPEEGS